MKYNELKEGEKYIVGYSLRWLHYFKPGTTITIDKKKSENSILCRGFDHNGNECYQHLFPEQILKPVN